MVPIVAIALWAGGRASADCATVATHDEAQVRVGTTTLTFFEESVCAGGETAARLLITDGDVVLCDRTDVDPGFDPFLFGAGIHNAPDDTCGADVSMVSTNVPKPAVDVDRAMVLLVKDDAETEPFGRLWAPGFSVQIPTHTAAVVGRGVRVAAL